MMGIFAMLRRFACAESIKSLESSIAQIRLGIFSRLLKKYRLIYGEQDSKFLSAAILNEAVLEKPGNRDGKHYYQNNLRVIKEETLNLASEPDLSKALSYLYAAQTLYLVFITGKPFSKRSKELGDQATRLSIYIPNTYDICGSGDAKKCILAIAKYANNIIEEST